jgi:hypothetical protein
MYSNVKWKQLHACLHNTNKRKQPMNDQELRSFLEAFDALCQICMDAGIPSSQIAGAVLARVQHLYLADDQADIEGLVRLLELPLERLKSRPRFDIE